MTGGRGKGLSAGRIKSIRQAGRAHFRKTRSNSPVGRGGRIRSRQRANASRAIANAQAQGRSQAPRRSVRKINGTWYRGRTSQAGVNMTPLRQAAHERANR